MPTQNVLKILSFSRFLAILLTVSSCQKEQSFELFVKVVSQTKTPIDGVKIRIDEKEIGQTNKNGEYFSAHFFKLDQPVAIALAKESTKAYFSPVNAQLTPTQEKNRLSLESTMYVIEKSGSTDFTEKPLAISPNERLSEPTDSTEVSSLMNQNLDANNGKLSTLEFVDIGSSFVNGPQRDQPVGQDSTPVEERKIKETTEKTWLTVYVRDQHGHGLQNAAVTLFSSDGTQRELGITQTDGRVFFELSPNERKNSTLLISSTSYESKEQKLEKVASEKNTISIVLKKGLALDVEVLSFNGSLKPLSGVSVYVNDKLFGKTNDLGRLNSSLGLKPGELATVKLVAESIRNSAAGKPEVYETNFVIDETIQMQKTFVNNPKPGTYKIALSVEENAFSLGKSKEWFTGIKNQIEKSGFEIVSLGQVELLPATPLSKIPVLTLNQDQEKVSVELSYNDDLKWKHVPDLKKSPSFFVDLLKQKLPSFSWVKEYSKGFARLNALPREFPNVKIGQRVEIIGQQRDESGNAVLTTVSGRGEVSALSNTGIEINLSQVMPRSLIVSGDIAVISTTNEEEGMNKDKLVLKE